MTHSILLQIALACLLGGALSVVAAALVMFGLPRKWLALTVSFSTGLLLATATLHLLPEALESGLTPHELFPLLLAGILGFFALEKFALWRHAHSGAGDLDAQCDPQCDDHTHSHHHLEGAHGASLLILIGDGFHNFTDGLLIAAAFLADPALGWATTFAIIAHEVPQEAGDFAILLAAGWKRGRALFWNGVSSLAALAGGVIGYLALERALDWVPAIITLAAASFLYIAVADLMPRLKRETADIGWHGLLLAAGIAVVVFGSAHAHAGEAHVHGAGRLDVAIDKGQVGITLELPLDAIVGFERAPKNDREKAALGAAEKVLDDAAALFVPTPAANCAVKSARVDMPKFGGGEHADIDARYEFRCANPAALKGIETTIFRHFRRLYRLEVRRAGPAGQGAGRLAPKNPVLGW
ncbi:MAG: DUF2796 domain-containing protein [Candidatus Nitricoxidivorans perseverans]|uniref:DUF2796 domain-containing protein n=1 Tax=Candidatus Nitricoxidivorans perseverans TaxID=2975601 RepID=A0AA49FJE5_9PROT|nr:MAG: DUF2796 domain-containing protein [Candidatus Nitricoxidivorans perseverans]